MSIQDNYYAGVDTLYGTPVNVLSFGGGVDSSTLVAIDLYRNAAAQWLHISREDLDTVFPPVDRFVFADTGAESAATYRNVEKVNTALNGLLNIVRKDGETITEWCLRLGSVPLMPGGSHVCSLKYKGEVMDKWAKAQNIDPVWIIGIEANEERRAKRFKAPAGKTYLYPLIELGMTRERCQAFLKLVGWHGVEKSSCVFCPFKSEEELRDMYYNDPEGWALSERLEARFKEASVIKHQAWLDAAKPLNKGGRAPRGMWRKNSYAEGARLFAKKINGRQLSMAEWAQHFQNIDNRRIA